MVMVVVVARQACSGPHVLHACPLSLPRPAPPSAFESRGRCGPPRLVLLGPVVATAHLSAAAAAAAAARTCLGTIRRTYIDKHSTNPFAMLHTRR